MGAQRYWPQRPVLSGRKPTSTDGTLSRMSGEIRTKRMILQTYLRFEPKGGASVKQQMGKRKKGIKGKKGIRQKEAKATQATNALKEALAVFAKSGCTLEVAQEIVREAFRKKEK